MNKIQVGFLVSYDYELLKNAIPPIYEDSDTIFLAIDKNRKTWKGSNIEIDSSFFEWLKNFDTSNKIELYEDDFYVEGMSTMECEVRERKMLAEKMGIGNWLIQLDSDEYFLDFKKFVNFLKSNNHYLKNPEKHIIQICPFKINLYKNSEEGVFYVDQLDKFMAATNYPNYKIGRHGKCRSIYTDSVALHECLSRTREDLIVKLENWGHNTDIDQNAFMAKWDSVNTGNYKSLQGFFYLNPMEWKDLEYMPGKNIGELLENFKKSSKIKVGSFFLWKKNLGQQLKFMFK